uniref:Sesquipedalian n=2 Tax=Micrurus TaxID=8634 RepID=A0A2D4ILD5_MICLE
MKLNERSVVHYARCDSPADHTGFLCKRMERYHHNHHVPSYQRRWFILKGNLLFYFEERESCDPLGLIVLEGCTVELCEAAEEFAFAIRFDGSGGKSYVLVADCQVAMEAWVKALSRASFDYMRLVVKELEKQLEEAQRSLAASHKSPKKLSSGRKRHLSNPMMIPIQEHPVILENGYSTWDNSCTLAEMACSDLSGGLLKPPPLPPRRKLTGSAIGGAFLAGSASATQESPVSPETTCFSKLHNWYGQEIAEVRREWMERKKTVEIGTH